MFRVTQFPAEYVGEVDGKTPKYIAIRSTRLSNRLKLGSITDPMHFWLRLNYLFCLLFGKDRRASRGLKLNETIASDRFHKKMNM